MLYGGKMLKTKIDWCDYTWNPVWGCLMGCPYCYARKISKRFVKKIIEKEMNFLNNYCEFCGFDYFSKLQKFEPTFIWSNFQKEFPKKNSMIFVNSMSDISFWEDEWMNKVLWKIKEYSQHIFMFLTKDTSIYADYDFPENCWLGYTFITQK